MMNKRNIAFLGMLASSILMGEMQKNSIKCETQTKLLNVDELKKILQLSLDYLEFRRVQEIKFENEGYYPKIWRKDIKFDDPEYMKRPNFGLGDLDDDIVDLKRVLKDPDDFLSFHIEKLGIILETVGALLDEGTYFQMPGKRCCPTLSFEQLKKFFELTVIYCDENKQLLFGSGDGRYLKIPHKEVKLFDDNFWKHPPYEIRSLNQDISDLKKVLTGEVKMDAVLLQKVGALLTAIGETI